MQIEGTTLIFIMNFSVQDFFKFASRMPQIAEVSLDLQNFPGRGRGGGGFPLFFISDSRLCIAQIFHNS